MSDQKRDGVTALWKSLTYVQPLTMTECLADRTQEVIPMVSGKFKKGQFVIVNAEKAKDYSKATRDVLIYVTKDYADWRKEQRPWGYEDPKEYFGGIPLVDKNIDGKSHWYEAEDFHVADDDLVQKRLDFVKECNKKYEQEQWKTGDCIQLSEDIEVKRGFFFFSFICKIRKGTQCVVDASNGDYEQTEKLDPNRGHEEVEPVASCDIADDVKIGKWMLKDFLAPLLSVFFPESESQEYVPAFQIERRVHSLKDVELVLPNGYIERIMRVVNRVVQRKTCEAIYDRLGLWQVCQKGRGALVLLYGPPGTGKTMTAEVIADRIGRPLIRVSLRMFDNKIMERLKEAFTRAQKYNAVLLLDEVDVFIRKRGDNPLFDEHTAIFLRALEYYDGILFMTTNLINTIDPAVFSRVHVCLGFDSSDQDRKAIWKSLLTPKLLECVRGTAAEHEEAIDRMSKLKINGREIKTVIQNGISHAIYELNGKPIPEGVKWISMKYFTDEAESLQAQRDELKRG